MKRRQGIVAGAAVAAALCLATPAGAVCPADTDRDGMVDYKDLICVLEFYGCNSIDDAANGNWRIADCNKDGCVGPMDVIDVFSNWGKCPIVPEVGD